MSRIGKQPVKFKAPVEVAVVGGVVRVKGPKGELELSVPVGIKVRVEEGELVVGRESDKPKVRALHGLVRSLVCNMVGGVTEGWTKKLELVGTGYRVKLEGDALVLSVGYSHLVKIEPEEGVSFEVEGNTKVTVSGIDKVKVGQVAARIRAVRPPEPYKGKGIRYEGEVVRRKPGKAAARAGVGTAAA